ncbi:MAG: ATP-binding protein [Candidatus Omnitrophota bacterium]
MNYYIISSLAIILCGFVLAAFVLFKNMKGLISKLFVFWTMSGVVWGFGLYKLFTANFHNEALFWGKFSHAGAIFIPAFFLHLVYSLTNKKAQKIVFIGYAISCTLLLCDFTPLFIKDVVAKLNFKYYYVPNIAYHFFTLYFFSGITYAHYVAYKQFRLESGLKRKQLKCFLIAFVPAFFGGFTTFLLVYNIPIPPIGLILIPPYTIIIAYAIVRHQLMDIEVIIKKTLVFATLFTLVFGIFVGVALLLQHVIGAGNNLLGFAISSLIIVFTVRPLEIFLIKITDRYLFQKKYDYKHLIREFMDELRTMVLNTAGIAQSTIDFLNTSIRPTIAAVFLYNKFTNKYDLITSSDFKEKDFKIANDSMTIKALGETGKIIKINDDKLISLKERDQFIVLGIGLIIPLLIHKELIGLLCLGKKKSDEDYAEEDIETLSGLSGALAISLNNAQLFDERADAEKRALVGTIATGINHEIGNPLNIITIKLDTFRILAKEGLLAHKTKEEIIDEVDKMTKICLDSTQRIAEITKQVAEFAKPDKKLIFDKVNVNETIDETIVFLKHGMILDAGKIEKNILCDPVYAIADRGQLKQILFNLIKNASHAIDNETGRIVVSVDRNNVGEIIIKITDNGHGMPKNVLEKVFTPFFTTKEPGKGTGLGLALVKIMIDRNNAKIKVESEEGEGTTFTLVFKGGLL